MLKTASDRMSVSMTRADGVTVFTLTSDPQSPWPPLCQVFKALCYNPVCCTVSQHLRRAQRASLSALGTLHIMVGLLNIGLGVILLCSISGSSWQMDSTWFPVWLGVLFMIFGIMCIVSEKFPSPCLVILNVILNLAGVGFAIAAIALYSINIADIFLWWDCGHEIYYYGTTPSPSPEEMVLRERCIEGQEITQMLLRSINAVLIVLSVLELCITISSVILGIKALRSREKEENKSTDDPELHQPLLEEVTTK
ncbi:B-lymphocyte antigen CD20-like isoform X1, partial [Lates japonicus]